MSVTAPKPRRRVIRDDGPDPVDIFVGKRVRYRRRQVDLSQSALATRLGVTFQQLQKYESAANRISASALYRLGHALGVAPGYFFEGYADAPFEAAIKLKRKAKR
jgi:transcriptional regulator with XRE-family HTH domain